MEKREEAFASFGSVLALAPRRHWRLARACTAPYVGRVERGESGITVEMLVTVLGAMSVSPAEFFRFFDEPILVKTPRRKSRLLLDPAASYAIRRDAYLLARAVRAVPTRPSREVAQS